MPRAQVDQQPPGRDVNWFAAAVITAVLIAAAILALYTMAAFWPRSTSSANSTPAVHALFAHHYKVSRDGELFAIVACAGTLGGLVHALRSLYWYVGNRGFKWSWLVFYAVIPIVGAVLATIFYLVLRGGLVSGQDASSNVNPYGSAAVAALVGLFTAEAAEKLREIFSSIFSSSPKGDDTVPPAPEGSITDVEPSHGPIGTKVTLRGAGLGEVSAVYFSGVLATFERVAANEVVATVPDQAQSGRITVTAANKTLTAPVDFTVEPS